LKVTEESHQVNLWILYEEALLIVVKK
jgi:hypothetical protein